MGVCYAYKFIRHDDGTVDAVNLKDYNRLLREGKIVETKDGFHYAKDTIGVLLNGQSLPMRWDLIPEGFAKGKGLTVGEAVKRKNSRAKDPETGRAVGFSSFNARIETVRSLPSFKGPWWSGKRCLVPVDAFKERPNMDEAPKEHKGREYEIALPETMYFAGIWDTWTGKDGDTLDSCTVITMSSEGLEPLRAIWHERVPVLLKEEDCQQWLDLKTTPETAFELCRQVGLEYLSISEVIKPPKSN